MLDWTVDSDDCYRLSTCQSLAHGAVFVEFVEGVNVCRRGKRMETAAK